METNLNMKSSEAFNAGTAKQMRYQSRSTSQRRNRPRGGRNS